MYRSGSSRRSPEAPCGERCARATPRAGLEQNGHRTEARTSSSYESCCQCFPERAAGMEKNNRYSCYIHLVGFE